MYKEVVAKIFSFSKVLSQNPLRQIEARSCQSLKIQNSSLQVKAGREVTSQYIRCCNGCFNGGKKVCIKIFCTKNISSSTNRYIIWRNKTDSAKLSAKQPTLKSLPPADKALKTKHKAC